MTSKRIYWAYLMAAIAFELFGTTCMKLSNGFTEPLFIAGTVVGYGICFTLFSQALVELPLGLSYAIWGGLGTVGTCIIGLAAFGDPMSPIMLAGIVLILVGTAILNLDYSDGE